MSYSFDPDQVQRFVGPDLGPNSKNKSGFKLLSKTLTDIRSKNVSPFGDNLFLLINYFQGNKICLLKGMYMQNRSILSLLSPVFIICARENALTTNHRFDKYTRR